MIITPLVEALLEGRGQVDMNALVIAAHKKTAHCLELLLKARQEIDVMMITDGYGQTLLHHARYLQVVQFLVEKYPGLVTMVDNNKDSPLMKITPLLATPKLKKYERVKEIIVFLQKKGANINNPNQQGCTALHDALIKKHGGRKHLPLVIKTLLELNANLTDHENTSTLHLACKTGMTQVVRQIIRAGRKTNRIEFLKSITRDVSLKEVVQKYGDEKMMFEIETLLSYARSTFSLSQSSFYRVLDISSRTFPLHHTSHIFRLGTRNSQPRGSN
jgi:ankyrin repeat protein